MDCCRQMPLLRAKSSALKMIKGLMNSPALWLKKASAFLYLKASGVRDARKDFDDI